MKGKIFHLIFFFLFCAGLRSTASPETILGGSYIINMGVTPQTVANGLKPYGLIYDLLKNYRVPVKWIINSSKSKDGIDFSHNSADYAGGCFIIQSEYRTTAVNNAISSWESLGVVGATTISAISVDVFMTLHHPPIWTLDKDNGSIVVGFFTNAGVPASAYGGSSSSSWKDPSQLAACDDIFVLPHADPTWATHNNLYYWNLNYKGHIWAGCHAVSVLENITDPTNTIQLNFLSTTGLVPYGSHGNGSPPYTYSQSADGVMQFMQVMDGSTANGSERIYMPRLGGGWRPSTHIGVYDNTQTNVPSASPGPAAVVAYGRGYGDDARGWVMYEGGHNLNNGGSIAERVAAQRAFFNFSYFSASNKNAWFDIQLQNIPNVLMANTPYNISFTVPPEVNMSDYTFRWTASCAGSFSSDNQQAVTFTPTATYTNCIISVTFFDVCGREIFASKGIYVSELPLNVGVTLNAKYETASRSVSLQWPSFDEKGTQYFEIERSRDGNNFSTIKRVTVITGSSFYSETDEYPEEGAGYYRLKILKEDGSLQYSNLVKVNIANQLSFKIQPNPSKEKISLLYYSDQDDVLGLRLVNMYGQVVFNKNEKAGRGKAVIPIEVNGNISPGTYLLIISTAKGRFTERVIIMK